MKANRQRLDETKFLQRKVGAIEGVLSLARLSGPVEAMGLRSEHGARVYGAEEIPTESYRIPALFVTPDASLHGKRIERLCSQIDLVPTLLSLAGIATRAPFFGSDLLELQSDGGRAFVHHNRDVGILTDDALVVLGLQKTVTFYTRSGRDSDQFTRVDESAATPRLRELEADAAAVFGTADELYTNRRLRLASDLRDQGLAVEASVTEH